MLSTVGRLQGPVATVTGSLVTWWLDLKSRQPSDIRFPLRSRRCLAGHGVGRRWVRKSIVAGVWDQERHKIRRKRSKEVNSIEKRRVEGQAGWGWRHGEGMVAPGHTVVRKRGGHRCHLR